MFILDKPYVSPFLLETISRGGIEVLENDFARQVAKEHPIPLVSNEQARDRQRAKSYPRIYCNSENSIHWIREHLSHCDLPQKIELFKNKVLFRDLLKPQYPDYFYAAVPYAELDAFDIDQVPLPVIVKPAVGFFSMGVYRVDTAAEWKTAVAAIQKEMQQVRGLYPSEVMDTETFIVEEVIEGTEYAVDAYFNEQGRPVILNILEHVFSSGHDVSDRLYLTSGAIIENHLERFTAWLQQIGSVAQLRNFPMHIELRITAQGDIIPIEVNPMRFAGWCTTDIAAHAFGVNVYEYVLEQKKPVWGSILKNCSGQTFALVVADVPKSIDAKKITAVDYDRFLEQFSTPLELRRIDVHQYPVFAFVFARLDRVDEVERILNLDFAAFLQVTR